MAMAMPLVSLSAVKPHLLFVLVDDMGHNDFYDSSDLSFAWKRTAKRE